jgi:hypothetical protein
VVEYLALLSIGSKSVAILGCIVVLFLFFICLFSKISSFLFHAVEFVLRSHRIVNIGYHLIATVIRRLSQHTEKVLYFVLQIVDQKAEDCRVAVILGCIAAWWSGVQPRIRSLRTVTSANQ